MAVSKLDSTPLPSREILTAEQLAERLQLPKTWIFEQTRNRASDPIPHIRLGKYVRFDVRSEALTDWINRRVRK